MSASALRTGLLNDAEARDRLFGGSVTLDRHLLLVAASGTPSSRARSRPSWAAT